MRHNRRCKKQNALDSVRRWLCGGWLFGGSVRERSGGRGCGQDDLDGAARAVEGRGSSSVGGVDRGDDLEAKAGSHARSGGVGFRESVEGVLGESTLFPRATVFQF